MRDNDLTFTVDVGFTTTRPVVVDQFVSRVVLFADSLADAITTAFTMVGSRPTVEMVTSTTVVTVVA